jgi:hypothetical protein
MKKFIKHKGKKYVFALDHYVIGGRYALLLVSTDGDSELLSSNILDDKDNPRAPEDCICVDLNSSIAAELFLKLWRKGFIENTGKVEFSGFCAYPVCRLNLEKIKEYSDETVAR